MIQSFQQNVSSFAEERLLQGLIRILLQTKLLSVKLLSHLLNNLEDV